MTRSNIAIHLSRHRKVICFVSLTMRPGDGSVRSILIGWVATKLDELPPQSKKYLDGHHRKMNPHHKTMVHLDYHGAQQ